MRTGETPKLATWLLNHFEPINRNEALIGDLAEQYRRGRSRSWYWRQVVVAVLVGYCKELARGTTLKTPC
jgi:hypothetical protein